MGRTYFILIATICLALFYIVIRLDRTREHTGTIFYTKALGAEHISAHVTIRGIGYTVSGQGVVADNGAPASVSASYNAAWVAYAQALAQRSPVLALPSVDPDGLNDSIAQLQSVQNKLADLQHDPQDRAAVRTSLYPIQFLYSISSLERARRQFIESGDIADEYRYLVAIKKTVRAYSDALREHREQFDRVVPSDAAAYQTFDGVITRASTVTLMDQMRKGIDATAEKLARRQLCINGDTKMCDASDLALPAIAQTALDTPVQKTDPILTAEVLSLYRSATKNAQYGQVPVVELAGPVACPATRTAAPVYSLITRIPGHPNTANPEFVGDLLFVPTASFAQVPFYAYFREQGVSYAYFPIMEYYKCASLPNDFSRVFAVSLILDAAKNVPLSAAANDPEEKAVLRGMELALVPPHGVVSEQLALRYLSAARTAILGSVDRSNDAITHLTTLTLAETDHSAGLEQFIRRAAQDEQENLTLGSAGTPVEQNVHYLFYIRSGIFAFFLGTNPSVAGIQHPPVSSIVSPSTQLPYIPYSTLRSSVSRDQILRDMTFFFHMHAQAENKSDHE